MSSGHGKSAQPKKKFTTRCLSPLPSACTTATLTAWQRGLRATQICIARMAGGSLKWATSSQPRSYLRSRNNMPSRRWRLSPFARRLLLSLLFVLTIAYLSFGTFVWWAIHQPPETFGRVMTRMPGPVPFLLFPFETAWLHARAGALHPGDPAPDFSLVKVDKSERVQLSVLNHRQPVVFSIRQLHLTSVPAGGSCPE